MTGVLPLFINKEHWLFSRLRMKPLLGYLCTLSPLGFSHGQARRPNCLIGIL